MMKKSVALACCLLAACLLASSCSRRGAAGNLTPIILQTDWYPQPEHGGFYDAQLKGYYRQEGLEVVIRPGGPYVNSEQQVSNGSAQFALGSSDRILQAISSGQPLIAVGATMQSDPQAIMLHKDSPVRSFADLDGHAIAIKPPATWFSYLVRRYHLTTVREIPATFSVANFIQDPQYIQQIFITSEPYFARQAGVEIRTMLISDTGYNPYRVFFTSQPWLQQHPDIAEKFVRASLRGWADYMNDPTETNAEIARLNPAMSIGQMQFTWQALKDGGFVTGPDGASVGRFDPARWKSMYEQLTELKVIQKPFDPATAYTTRFLPPQK